MENKKTIDEVLLDAFADECHGITEYLKMSKQAEQEYPGKAYAQILRDIAREERVHKNHLKDILQDSGISLTQELKDADRESEEVYESSFC